MTSRDPRASEARLDELRRKAAAGEPLGTAGVVAQGGPMPKSLAQSGGVGAAGAPTGAARDTAGSAASAAPTSYHGRPVLKPAPWTWEVPLYLFAGGVAGGSSVLALAARVGGAPPATVSMALQVAVVGVLASALLLVSDLGRPARFLNMLRVFKWRSPMSVGVWLLTAFGGAVTVALVLQYAGGDPASGDVGAAASGAVVGGASMAGWVGALQWAALALSAALGALVATYTGVLLAATVVPAWNTHRVLLPVHFGAAALGSSAALLELLGDPLPALRAVGVAAAAVETAVALWTELQSHGARDASLRRGRSGLLVRASGLLVGPAPLLLRALGLHPAAAAVFLVGALVGRFGWLEAGRVSTQDPAAAL